MKENPYQLITFIEIVQHKGKNTSTWLSESRENCEFTYHTGDSEQANGHFRTYFSKPNFNADQTRHMIFSISTRFVCKFTVLEIVYVRLFHIRTAKKGVFNWASAQSFSLHIVIHTPGIPLLNTRHIHATKCYRYKYHRQSLLFIAIDSNLFSQTIW